MSAESLPKRRVVNVVISPLPKNIRLVDDHTLAYTYGMVLVIDRRRQVVKAWKDIRPTEAGASRRRKHFNKVLGTSARPSLANLTFWDEKYPGIPVLYNKRQGDKPDAAFSILTLTTNEKKQWTQLEYNPRWYRTYDYQTDGGKKHIIIALTHDERRIAYHSQCADPAYNKVIIWGSRISFTPTNQY